MKLRRFQVGGAMPAEAAAPGAAPEAAMAPGAGAEQMGGAEQDPMMMIIQAAMQAVQSNDGNMALQVCAALVQMLQQAGGAGPEEAGAAPQGEPVFRNGGVLAYRCGGKSKSKKTKKMVYGGNALKKRC